MEGMRSTSRYKPTSNGPLRQGNMLSKYIIDLDGAQFGQPYTAYETDGKKPIRVITPSKDNQPCWSDKQLQFFDSEAPYTLFGGARGGGKSEAIVWLAIFRAHLRPRCSQIIFRRTMGELEKTIIERFREIPPEIAGTYVGKQGNEHMLFPNKSKIYFASAPNEDDVRKFLSGEYETMIFDEWSEFPYEMWRFTAGSCRTTRDKDELGRPVIAQIFGCSNPGGTGGDSLRDLFGCEGEQKAPASDDPSSYRPSEYLFIKALVSDNPAYAADTPAGIAYRAMLASQPAARRAAWLEGRWSGFEGQYFDNFNKDASTIPHDLVISLMASQPWQPRWISIDWGQIHHAYASWHTFIELQLSDGTTTKIPLTYREYLIKGLGETGLASEICDRTMADEIKKIDAIYLSPETFGDSLFSRAERMSGIFISRNFPRPQRAYNKREDGWRLMHELLSARKKLDGGWQASNGPEVDTVGGWLIDESCQSLINALPWAMSDPHKDGDIRKEGDSPNLDILDGARYGIASRIQPEEKPFSKRLQETIALIPPVGSARYIKHLIMQKEEKTATPPVFYGTKMRPRIHQSR